MKIAERILKIRQSGTEIEVPIRIYAPARDDECMVMRL